MSKWVNALHKKFPFLNNVISLILGAVISYTIQFFIDTLRQSAHLGVKIFSLFVFSVSIALTIMYFKFFSSDSGRKMEFLEIEREKNEIQRLKDERIMISCLYK